jgi:hypothetical protein
MGRPRHQSYPSRSLDEVRNTDPVTLSTDDGIHVRIQLLNAQGYPPWPTALTPVRQRYTDAGAVELRTPTRDSFAAAKTVAWFDRAAPRDLSDLWALAQIGALTKSAARLFREHGPISAPPQPYMFSRPPTEAAWREQLAAQTRLTVGPEQALNAVRAGWSSVVGSGDAEWGGTNHRQEHGARADTR